jgi:hypothetical protein
MYGNLAAVEAARTGELGKRCRVVLEPTAVNRRKFQDFILKPPKMAPALLRNLYRGMAQCCKRMKVKYYFLGYGEEVYKQDSWKPLGSVLKPVEPTAKSIGDLDCRTLRFDGLYCHDLGGGGKYLRFYPDDQFISVLVSEGSPSDVARWFSREWKPATTGTYKVQGSSLVAGYEVESLPGQEPTVFKLKGRLTEQGMKVRTWSSYSKKESNEVYAFHKVKLK